MAALSTWVAMLAWAISSAAPQADPYPSPSGRYAVVFEEIAHRTFSGEEQLHALDNVDHIEYEVSFLRCGARAVAASVRYVDVYGFNQPPDPTPLDRIHDWLVWSPEEDFVVLPSEGWASAPGTPERKVVSLNERHGWSESRITLQNLTWADSLRTVGDRHSDCDYSVDAFDGEAGVQRPVLEPASPIGYRIASVAGRTMLIRRVLDNCASEEQRAVSTDRCLSVNLDTMSAVGTPCP